MRKFLALTALAAMSVVYLPLAAQGATKPVKPTNTVKTIRQSPMLAITPAAISEQSRGMLVKGRTIYVFGTITGVVTTDGFVQAMDATGRVLWSLALDTGYNEIATAGTIDASGNLWIAGGTQTPTVLPSPSPTPSTSATTSASPSPSASSSTSASPTATSSATSTPTPIPTLLNPDGVTVDPVEPLRKDLTSLVLWKISPAGVLLGTYESEIGGPFLVKGAIFANNTISVVGQIATPTGHAGMLVQSDVNGKFSKPILLGKSDTEFNAVAKQSDGSLLVVGASSETIAKQSPQGTKDGLLVVVTAVGKISTVIRSSNAATTRSWQSATNSFFNGGDAVSTSKREAVVTKYSSKLVPTWTKRFTSTTPALTVDDSTSHYMLFASKGAIQGITGWAPKKDSLLFLRLDSKGALTGAYGALSLATPMAVGYSRELGIVVMGRGSGGVLIFHALPR